MAPPKQSISQYQQQQLRLNLKQVLLGRLLEMSAPEFEEEIVRAMEENPAITTADDEADQTDGNDSRNDVSGSDDDDFDDDFDDELPYTGTAHRDTFYRGSADSYSEAEIIEQQLADLHLTDVERETAHYIIGNLDSSGYLTRSSAAIADDMALTAGLDVPLPVVEKMIRTVKSLDPAGIGAENLRECLLIQLGRLPKTPAAVLAGEIIGKYYKQFVNNRADVVREATGASENDFEAALKLIRSLNPKPGADLFDHSDDRSRHITPDFIIDVDDDGRLVASLAGNVPDLTIDSAFRLDDARTVDPKAAEFIKERRDGAEAFIDAVKRRGATLMAIMKAIVRLQPDFFRTFELRDLRPMVIRDIETLTGLDKSVISRATSSKYMLTPHGIFPVKAMFSESAGKDAEIGPRKVEDAIRKLVGEENKAEPLSDDDLTDSLNAMGLAVARRTVAKYRERLGIPVARLRKKY